jgi:hypothetical protein
MTPDLNEDSNSTSTATANTKNNNNNVSSQNKEKTHNSSTSLPCSSKSVVNNLKRKNLDLDDELTDTKTKSTHIDSACSNFNPHQLKTRSQKAKAAAALSTLKPTCEDTLVGTSSLHSLAIMVYLYLYFNLQYSSYHKLVF